MIGKFNVIPFMLEEAQERLFFVRNGMSFGQVINGSRKGNQK
jgi:hypothetical protein